MDSGRTKAYDRPIEAAPTSILISTRGSQMPSRTGLSGALTWHFYMQKSAAPNETDGWSRQHRLEKYHACIKHTVDSINNFCEKDVHVQCADGQVKAGYPYLSQCILFYPGYLGLSTGTPPYAADSQVLCDSNFKVNCETGIGYPTLPTMLNHDALLVGISVRSIPCHPGLSHVVVGYLILQMG